MKATQTLASLDGEVRVVAAAAKFLAHCVVPLDVEHDELLGGENQLQEIEQEVANAFRRSNVIVIGGQH